MTDDIALAAAKVFAPVKHRSPHDITMDSNEHDDFTDTMLRGMGYTLTRARLLTGDFSWTLQHGSFLRDFRGFEAVLVERKTLADIRDTKRLMDQLSRMTDPAVFYIILIDHRQDTDIGRSWSDDALFNAEMSLSLGGMTVTHCTGGHIAARIDSIWRWTNKHKHSLAGEE